MDLKDPLESVELLDQSEIKDLKDHKDPLDQEDQLELLVFKDHKDLKDPLDQEDPQELLDPQELTECSDLKDQWERLDALENKECPLTLFTISTPLSTPSLPTQETTKHSNCSLSQLELWLPTLPSDY